MKKKTNDTHIQESPSKTAERIILKELRGQLGKSNNDDELDR